MAKCLALLLPIAANVGAQERIFERHSDPQPVARGEALLRPAMLSGHNVARRAAGVPAIQWNEALVVEAQRWADSLARSGQMRHSDGPSRPGQGENLWTGTRGAYRYHEMVGHWLAESRDYIDAPTPRFSRTGRWQDVVHYTQIVWRGTTEVGCAVAANGYDEYLVCRYAPVGNVVGQRVF